jgi:hypothetical protein
MGRLWAVTQPMVAPSFLALAKKKKKTMSIAKHALVVTMTAVTTVNALPMGRWCLVPSSPVSGRAFQRVWIVPTHHRRLGRSVPSTYERAPMVPLLIETHPMVAPSFPALAKKKKKMSIVKHARVGTMTAVTTANALPMGHRWRLVPSSPVSGRAFQSVWIVPTHHRRRLRSSVPSTYKHVPMGPLWAVTHRTIVRFPLVPLIVTFVREGSLTVAIIAVVEKKAVLFAH